MSNKFTIYWMNGTKSYINGENFDEAVNNAGYGKCQGVIDFWRHGIDDSYTRDLVKKEWVKKAPIHMHINDAVKNQEWVAQFISENIDTASELIFDCANNDQLVVTKTPHHFASGWCVVVEIFFAEYNQGSYCGDPEETHHYQATSIEYDDPNNIDQVIQRVLKRINNPFKESGIQSVDLDELTKIQNL